MPIVAPRRLPLCAALALVACSGEPTVSTPVVPGAPTALQVTAGDAMATVAFSAPASSGSSAVTGYVASCQGASTSRQGEGTTSPIAVTGLTNDAAYACTVMARNAAGTGPAATAVTVTPRAPLTVPGTPALVSVTRANAAAVVAFTPPGANGGSAITWYTATCTPATGTVRTQTGAASPITVANLVNGAPYGCAVSATNAIGTGVASAPMTVTPATVPDAPSGISATAGDGLATVMFATSSADGGTPITGYTASCTASSGARTAAGTASPLVVTGLANAVATTCTVTATNATGTSPASTGVTVTPTAAPTAPAPPRNVAATAGNAAATLTFLAPVSDGGSAITGYVATCSAGAATATVSGAASPLTVTGLVNGVAYGCAVVARNAVGSSAASTSATVTPATVPGAPTGLAATAMNAAAQLSFTAPASNGGSGITGYTASCTAGTTTTATGTGSPIVVSALANGTAYTCTVAATNAVGTGAASTGVLVTPASGTSSTDPVACTQAYDAFNANANVNLQSTSSWSCGTQRVLAGNGVPNHAVTGGRFATPLSAQSVSQSFTLRPTIVSPNGSYVARGVLGFALNSVKFDPATDGTCSSTATSTQPGGGCVAAGGTDPWNLEAIGGAFQFGTDDSYGHTQPNGAYHYHGMPTRYLTLLGAGTQPTLVGWALDGFPIYARYGYTDPASSTSAVKVITSSWKTKAVADAGRPSTTTFPMGTFTQDYEYVAGSGDLDQCNGRTGVTPEFPQGIYHYYVTDTYPYVQRCLKGR